MLRQRQTPAECLPAKLTCPTPTQMTSSFQSHLTLRMSLLERPPQPPLGGGSSSSSSRAQGSPSLSACQLALAPPHSRAVERHMRHQQGPAQECSGSAVPAGVHLPDGSCLQRPAAGRRPRQECTPGAWAEPGRRLLMSCRARSRWAVQAGFCDPIPCLMMHLQAGMWHALLDMVLLCMLS